MPTLKLNRTNIRAIKRPASGQVDYFDTELRGFLLRVGARSMIYYARRKVNGKVHRIKLVDARLSTPEAARAKAYEVLRKLADGITPKIERRAATIADLTLNKAFEEMMGNKALKENTRKFYRGCLSRGLSSLQARPLREITPEEVLRLNNELGERNGKAYAHGCMRVLRLTFNYAIAAYRGENGVPLILYNPVQVLSSTKSWHRVRRRKTIVAKADHQRWFGAVSAMLNATHRDYLILIWLAGLRATEAASLKWDDVNLVKRSLKVGETKNHEPLEIPLSDYLHTMLSRRRKFYPTGNWVFPSTRSKSGHIAEQRAASETVVAASGIKFTPHDLRRGFITACYELGLPHYTMKMLVNHALDEHGDVTAGYIVTDLETLREPMQRITDHFLKLAGVATD